MKIKSSKKPRNEVEGERSNRKRSLMMRSFKVPVYTEENYQIEEDVVKEGNIRAGKGYLSMSLKE